MHFHVYVCITSGHFTCIAANIRIVIVPYKIIQDLSILVLVNQVLFLLTLSCWFGVRRQRTLQSSISTICSCILLREMHLIHLRLVPFLFIIHEFFVDTFQRVSHHC